MGYEDDEEIQTLLRQQDDFEPLRYISPYSRTNNERANSATKPKSRQRIMNGSEPVESEEIVASEKSSQETISTPGKQEITPQTYEFGETFGKK